MLVLAAVRYVSLWLLRLCHAGRPSEANPVYSDYTAEHFTPLSALFITNQCLAVLVSARPSLVVMPRCKCFWQISSNFPSWWNLTFICKVVFIYKTSCVLKLAKTSFGLAVVDIANLLAKLPTCTPTKSITINSLSNIHSAYLSLALGMKISGSLAAKYYTTMQTLCARFCLSHIRAWYSG